MKNMKRLCVLLLILAAVLMLTGCKSSDYKAAAKLLATGAYEEAEQAFSALGSYKDSEELAARARELALRAKLLGTYRLSDLKGASLDLSDYLDFSDSSSFIEISAGEDTTMNAACSFMFAPAFQVTGKLTVDSVTEEGLNCVLTIEVLNGMGWQKSVPLKLFYRNATDEIEWTYQDGLLSLTSFFSRAS